ncbi:MAG: amidohydrolase family protein [Chloracidobacterium sp.]|nr:amidohydrolase family protein [Chloracidobacterium sp.]
MTSVTDVSAGTDIGVYQQLMRQGKLKTRIYGCSTLADYKRWERTGVRSAFGDAMLRVGCLKGFADGSLGSTTAWLFEPYLDDPKSTGLPSDEIAKMPELVLAADKAGLQVNIHAIGDKANATVLDIYERTAAADGPRDRRFRIEHSQHLRQADIKRFGSLKVVASMPLFLSSTMVDGLGSESMRNACGVHMRFALCSIRGRYWRLGRTRLLHR